MSAICTCGLYYLLYMRFLLSILKVFYLLFLCLSIYNRFYIFHIYMFCDQVSTSACDFLATYGSSLCTLIDCISEMGK